MHGGLGSFGKDDFNVGTRHAGLRLNCLPYVPGNRRGSAVGPVQLPLQRSWGLPQHPPLGSEPLSLQLRRTVGLTGPSALSKQLPGKAAS